MPSNCVFSLLLSLDNYLLSTYKKNDPQKIWISFDSVARQQKPKVQIKISVLFLGRPVGTCVLANGSPVDALCHNPLVM